MSFFNKKDKKQEAETEPENMKIVTASTQGSAEPEPDDGGGNAPEMPEAAEADEAISIRDELEEEQEAGRAKFVIPDEDFGPLLPFVKNPDITDVDYNGQSLWTIDIANNKERVTDVEITDEFVERFCRKVANAKSFDFNQKNPIMEAETKELRISIVHKSVAVSGTSICIRKTPPFKRISEVTSVMTGYTSMQVLGLLANCIKAHMNIVVAGEPRAGKTELAKFLGCYIPDNERVITIEDVLEWRFKQLKPKADCIEMQTNDTLDYTGGIVASLKQNPNWIMIAETRGKEVASLINSFSTGVNGITTLHTDCVEKIPQRMLNMIDEASTEARVLGNIYEFVDVGIMVVIRKDPETGKKYRLISQVGFFTCEDGKMETHLIVDNGKLTGIPLPTSVQKKFAIGGVTGNLYINENADKKVRQQGEDPDELRELTINGPISQKDTIRPEAIPEDVKEKMEEEARLKQAEAEAARARQAEAAKAQQMEAAVETEQAAESEISATESAERATVEAAVEAAESVQVAEEFSTPAQAVETTESVQGSKVSPTPAQAVETAESVQGTEEFSTPAQAVETAESVQGTKAPSTPAQAVHVEAVKDTGTEPEPENTAHQAVQSRTAEDGGAEEPAEPAPVAKHKRPAIKQHKTRRVMEIPADAMQEAG